MNSTTSVFGIAAAICRSAATPIAVFQPCHAALLALSADLGRVGLHDVERAARQPRRKRLAPGHHLTAGDRNRTLATQLDEVIECIRPQRFLEPTNVIGGEHMRSSDGPFQLLWPIGVACARIDEQPTFAETIAGAPNDRFVQLRIVAAAERTPPDLERAEARVTSLLGRVPHWPRLFH